MLDMSFLDHTPAKQACDLIESFGFRAYFVGGCVRDSIRRETIHDFDIASSALPEEIADIFESRGYGVIGTGKAHGTVTVMLDSCSVEVTTMRNEGDYKDGRHPECVEFVKDIFLDLKRRDFTMNAIAYSVSEKKIIDPYGGVEDIKNSIIRAVGDPRIRFEEDALRILRAIRFSSVLGYSIESGTMEVMREKSENIKFLSSERIYSELVKLLCGDFAGKVLYDYFDIISKIVPQLSECQGFDQHSPYHCYDLLMHICRVVDSAPKVKHLRLAALFHDIGKPGCFSIDENNVGHFYGHARRSAEIADNILRMLKVDKKTSDRVLFLVRHHDTPIPIDEILIKKRLIGMGQENFFDLLSLAIADCKGQSPVVKYRLSQYEEIQETAEKILAGTDCFSMSNMKINGNDIIGLGVKEGKEVGAILSRLFDMVTSNEVENEHTALLKAASSILET